MNTATSNNNDWDRFLTAAHLGIPNQVPVALIVDSPWLPGYAGIDTRDYFLFPGSMAANQPGFIETFSRCSLDSGFLGRVWDGC